MLHVSKNAHFSFIIIIKSRKQCSKGIVEKFPCSGDPLVTPHQLVKGNRN